MQDAPTTHRHGIRIDSLGTFDVMDAETNAIAVSHLCGLANSHPGNTPSMREISRTGLRDVPPANVLGSNRIAVRLRSLPKAENQLPQELAHCVNG
jgi:hypothetical protein